MFSIMLYRRIWVVLWSHVHMLKSDTCLPFALNDFVARWVVLFSGEKGAGRTGCYVSRRKFLGSSIFASQVLGLFPQQQCESKHFLLKIVLAFFCDCDVRRKLPFEDLFRCFVSDVWGPFLFGLRTSKHNKNSKLYLWFQTYLILVKFELQCKKICSNVYKKRYITSYKKRI